jgi:ParB-like chromosome segregation protein Spo0J
MPERLGMRSSVNGSNQVSKVLSQALGRELAVRRVALDSLHLDPANARSHPERNLEAIKGSLARFGQVEPLVVLKASQRVIGGNGRLVAMRALGWRECDIVEVDLPATEAAALGIALNRTSELAEWDSQALSSILQALQSESALDGVGFNDREIQSIIDDAAAELESLDGRTQDVAPLQPDEATTRPGDLWVLGDHRLLCGDSSKREDLDRLLGGAGRDAAGPIFDGAVRRQAQLEFGVRRKAAQLEAAVFGARPRTWRRWERSWSPTSRRTPASPSSRSASHSGRSPRTSRCRSSA